MIAILDTLADGADLQSSELLVELVLVWEEVRGHSKKAIYELGTVHSYEVSWHSSDLWVKWEKRELLANKSGAVSGWAATILGRGKPMSNLANVVQQLRQERDQAQQKIEQLDQALKALTGLDGLRTTNGRSSGAQTSGRTRRTMSAAARKRIAAAQRARWAKWKAAQRRK